MTGLYQSGSTCSNKQGQTYTSSYDTWGNVTGRTVGSTSATLSYDGLDHLTKYDAGSNGQEQYIYDAAGNRVLRRSTSSGATSMTVYAFGLEEHLYNGTGVHQSDTYYYLLGGMLVGESTGTNTNMFLTDALGSVIETISATSGSAIVQGNQVYSPYGSSRYQQGTMGTAKGFTGQYNDSVSGLDYYGSRYYDPVVGRFLSADVLEGNGVGMDPYAYVGGNPETFSDPSGQFYAPPPGGGDGGSQAEKPDRTVGVAVAPPPGGGGRTSTTTSIPQGIVNSLSDVNLDPTSAGPDETFSSGNSSMTVNTNTGEITITVRNIAGVTVQVTSIWPTDPLSGTPPQGINARILAQKYGVHIYIGGTNPPQTQPGGTNPPQTQPGGSSQNPPGGGNPPPTSPPSPPGPNNPQSNSGNVVRVFLSQSRHPQTCAHIEDAINRGQPSILTKDSDPLRIRLRRADALRGLPPRPGFARDEYPMAMTLEGGTGADIRYIDPSDNSGAGASIGRQLDPYPNGTQFCIIITP